MYMVREMQRELDATISKGLTNITRLMEPTSTGTSDPLRDPELTIDGVEFVVSLSL